MAAPWAAAALTTALGCAKGGDLVVMSAVCTGAGGGEGAAGAVTVAPMGGATGPTGLGAGAGGEGGRAGWAAGGAGTWGAGLTKGMGRVGEVED
jgi:hypothetical protein